jgi:ATP-dependent exoDNAse (exonuclease V) alpha subunit
MISDELIYQILQDFGFAPTNEQRQALEVFARFMTARSDREVMIMRGSAGTGKTSLAGAIVKTLVRLGQKVVLMAPTGRSAKVFALNAGQKASTIHRKIYRQRGLGDDFNLNANLHHDTLFMIDEASMISNQFHDSVFGSGSLLDDLVQYVYEAGHNCRMLLLGDQAQLPPVGETESPALQADVLRCYGLHVSECDLNEVLRQSQQSGILYNATRIREGSAEAVVLPKIRLQGFADIRSVPGDELIETLNTSYGEVGTDETMVITRSNKRANIYNQGIRNTILGREEELCPGDMVMVVKNNYFHSKEIEFIANGDRARVQRVRNVRQLYGFRFADVWLQFPDYDNTELQSTVILDSLASEAPALTRQQNEALFQAVMDDYADIPRKPDRLKAIKNDRHFNALQVKYAYATTCHKAQGGQWAHVYIDQGYMTDEMLTPDYIHWLYTAFTRASEQLFLVNWPHSQTETTETER